MLGVSRTANYQMWPSFSAMMLNTCLMMNCGCDDDCSGDVVIVCGGCGDGGDFHSSGWDSDIH